MSERSQIVPAPEASISNKSLQRFILAARRRSRCRALALSDRRPKGQPQFSFSWLFGFFYFFTLCCGCLFWTIVHHATDAEWSVVVRRQLENIRSSSSHSLFLRSRFCCSPSSF